VTNNDGTFGRKQPSEIKESFYYSCIELPPRTITMVRVFVKTLTGQSWTLELASYSTGYDVKDMVEKNSDIPIGEQRLIFAGNVIEDGVMIREINPEYEMMIVVRRKPQKLLGCSVCKKETPTACTRCEIPYCSIECQKKDWSKHKISCKTPK
jgi:hypothetical protein